MPRTAGSKALLIVDADSGQSARTGSRRTDAGSAIEPTSGHVFTGNGEGNSVSEVDPVAMTVLRSVDTSGPVDAIAYDPTSARIYADEDDGTHLFVIDAKTFKLVKSIVAARAQAGVSRDRPQTHEVIRTSTIFGNRRDRSGYAEREAPRFQRRRSKPTIRCSTIRSSTRSSSRH